MELFYIYLWFKLDPVIGILSLVSGIGSFICLVFFLPRVLMDQDTKKASDYKTLVKYHNRLIYIVLLCLFGSIFIPSSKETAVLVASSYALDFAKSPEGQKTMTLLRQTANKMLDTALKETK